MGYPCSRGSAPRAPHVRSSLDHLRGPGRRRCSGPPDRRSSSCPVKARPLPRWRRRTPGYPPARRLDSTLRPKASSRARSSERPEEASSSAQWTAMRDAMDVRDGRTRGRRIAQGRRPEEIRHHRDEVVEFRSSTAESGETGPAPNPAGALPRTRRSAAPNPARSAGFFEDSKPARVRGRFRLDRRIRPPRSGSRRLRTSSSIMRTRGRIAHAMSRET